MLWTWSLIPVPGRLNRLLYQDERKILRIFGTDCEYVIPYSCVKKIRSDAVLVEIKEEKFLQKY